MLYEAPSGRTVRLGVHQHRVDRTSLTFGKVELIRHDGAGHLSFDERPFVLMVEQGYADLGPLEL